MKKFLLLILTLTYLTSTSGVIVYMHYCMGKMVEWNVAGNEKEKCTSCGMDKSKKTDKDCCKDKLKQLKITNAHSVKETLVKGLYLTALSLPVSFIEVPTTPFSSITEENPLSNAPPQSIGIAIYKRYCVFRI